MNKLFLKAETQHFIINYNEETLLSLDYDFPL